MASSSGNESDGFAEDTVVTRTTRTRSGRTSLPKATRRGRRRGGTQSRSTRATRKSTRIVQESDELEEMIDHDDQADPSSEMDDLKTIENDDFGLSSNDEGLRFVSEVDEPVFTDLRDQEEEFVIQETVNVYEEGNSNQHALFGENGSESNELEKESPEENNPQLEDEEVEDATEIEYIPEDSNTVEVLEEKEEVESGSHFSEEHQNSNEQPISEPDDSGNYHLKNEGSMDVDEQTDVAIAEESVDDDSQDQTLTQEVCSPVQASDESEEKSVEKKVAEVKKESTQEMEIDSKIDGISLEITKKIDVTVKSESSPLKQEQPTSGDTTVDNASNQPSSGKKRKRRGFSDKPADDFIPPQKKTSKEKETNHQNGDSVANKAEQQAKKATEAESYDPGSPTSENSSDETAAKKKPRKALPELEKYWKAVKEDAADFTGWTYLLQYVDQESVVEAAREAYNAFLALYPYCYGYWRKYADYEKKKGTMENCDKVFECGLKAIPLSVDLWLHYLNHCKNTHPDNETFIRAEFERALASCGKEFRSDRLWESYIKWEKDAKNLQNVTAIYDRLLATPTQGYTSHFDNFEAMVKANPPQKLLSIDEFLEVRRAVLLMCKVGEVPSAGSEGPDTESEDCPPGGQDSDEAASQKQVEETTLLREKIIDIRKEIHKATVAAVADRWNFEEGIKRPYFHVKPLEKSQLKNWKEYLDYEIEQGNRERIIVLFERCLIACALYEEYWIRFIQYLESQKDPLLTSKIRSVYERACTIHHTKKAMLHLQWAAFEEKEANWEKAAEILQKLEVQYPNMLQVAYRRINLERRRNNLDSAAALYECYIQSYKNQTISTNLAIKYARFCWKVKGEVQEAIGVLSKALEKDKANSRLYLQLIDMNMQKCPIDQADVVSVFDRFLQSEASPVNKAIFAQRKVEFLEDFGVDIVSVLSAQEEHQKFQRLARESKKSESSDTKTSDGLQGKKSGKQGSDWTPPMPSQPPPPHPPNVQQQQGYQYNQQNYQQPPYSNQYPPQQTPQQYGQPPYNQQYNQNDPGYANYAQWGGYGYNQGWGSYNYY